MSIKGSASNADRGIFAQKKKERKEDLSRGFENQRKTKLGVNMHFSEIIRQQQF